MSRPDYDELSTKRNTAWATFRQDYVWPHGLVNYGEMLSTKSNDGLGAIKKPKLDNARTLKGICYKATSGADDVWPDVWLSVSKDSELNEDGRGRSKNRSSREITSI